MEAHTNGEQRNGLPTAAATSEPPRPLNLAGKTAIVTGSSRGIGAGIALELASRGANVVVNFTSDSSRSAADHIPRGAGRIIIVSSVSARMGVPQQTIYAASKVATEALARVWATELGQPRGITVNCVNPGPVATDMYYASDQDCIDALKPLIDSTPAEARIGQVRDIAPLVG